MDDRTTVLFVAGSGRSGSTLLDNILGQIDGYFSGGELRYIWERGLLENRLCGCGRRFRECPVWQAVLHEAFGGMDGVDPRAMMRQQRMLTRVRHVPLLLARGRTLGASEAGVDGLADAIARLYRAVRTVTGTRVIVDSSKLPTYGYLLEANEAIDLRVVHLVRDPRAAAYSWMRKKAQPDRGAPGYMQRQRPLKTSVLWALWNSTAEAFWRRAPDRYLRLRYEDLVQDPRHSVLRILSLLGDRPGTLPFVDERTVALGPNHTVAGNPDRLKDGNVTLRADAEWVRKMPVRTRALVTAVTSPLLPHFGYSLRRADVGYSSR